MYNRGHVADYLGDIGGTCLFVVTITSKNSAPYRVRDAKSKRKGAFVYGAQSNTTMNAFTYFIIKCNGQVLRPERGTPVE